jgi:hypothetical protein
MSTVIPGSSSRSQTSGRTGLRAIRVCGSVDIREVVFKLWEPLSDLKKHHNLTAVLEVRTQQSPTRRL